MCLRICTYKDIEQNFRAARGSKYLCELTSRKMQSCKTRAAFSITIQGDNVLQQEHSLSDIHWVTSETMYPKIAVYESSWSKITPTEDPTDELLRVGQT